MCHNIGGLPERYSLTKAWELLCRMKLKSKKPHLIMNIRERFNINHRLM